jgi:hypothetical protein
MSIKSRKRQRRRDRRKAKMSGWRREGKQMGSHVGHGTSGGVTRTVVTLPKRPHQRSKEKESW